MIENIKELSKNPQVTSGLTGGILNLLRESKAEITEYLKMFHHYGFFSRVSPELKTLFRRPPNPGYGTDFPDDLRIAIKRIGELDRVNINTIDNPARIAFISYTIPRADSTSSELRLFNILNILLQNNYKIDFFYCARLWNDAKYIRFFDGDIRFTYLPLKMEGYISSLTDKSPDYIWITELWRMNYAAFMTELSQGLKRSNNSSKLIVDTVDFHFKEFYRKYELTRQADDLERANEFLKYEEILYRQADLIFVISEDEKKDIQANIQGIERIEIVPNIHDIPDTTRPFNKRKHICFVGHFGNKHNVDAATYFYQKIFQFILEKNSRIEFHLLGYGAEKYKSSFLSPNVKVIGSLKYLHEALQHYKLFVCPMTYGAGMKGKIGGAVAAGLPVVTTSIGAEGFPFTNGEESFITDSPEEFAERCHQCLTDAALWHRFSVMSRLVMAEKFSPRVIAAKLNELLSN